MNQSQYQVFALDGQHRVIGIKGAIALAAGGSLYRLDKTGKPKGEPIQLEDWRKPGTNPAVDLPRETVGIKLIPAVIQGETREESRRRIAEVFVHVNQTSSPLKEGDLAQIDPSDGYSIVARKIATSHPFLKKEPGRSARVNFSNNTVALRSTVFTTLATVKRMARLYLESDSQFSTWRSKAQRAKSIATKPDQNEIELAQERVWDFWSAFAELPSLQKLDPPVSASTGEFRRLPTDSDPGAGHLLFRPVGQQILAEAVGRVVHSLGSDRTLLDVFDQLSKFDEVGGFEIADPAQPWYGIVYSASMSRVLVAGQNLGAELLTYMLGGLADDIPQRLALRANFARARQSRDGFSFGFDGNEVPQDRLQLPEPLRKED
jgi:DGQHR domain-containing protein